MFSSILHEQTIISASQGDYLAFTIEAFLMDRQAGGLSRYTIKFYRQFPNPFLKYCEANSLNQINEITPDFLRRYLLVFAESHNAGGVHADFRTLRSFFCWILNEEIMPPEWRNPMLKIKGLKVPQEPLLPIDIQDIITLIESCSRGSSFGDRDRVIFLFLFDTGVRAQELCKTDIKDVDLFKGMVTIWHGKDGKSRTVYIGGKTRKALRTSLRQRRDQCPALFASRAGKRLTYFGLKQILIRRATSAGLEKKPTLNGFRRAFALNMLRAGVDLFSLQRLMGHADLQVMRRYLA